ncbi:hypothetical protein BJV82DRAFT_716389 [Fennellomyces sp. T-0311]|nr:hypothetical protein BJV82DRAFT_716389 [Fennellomyces sp. T-0311]
MSATIYAPLPDTVFTAGPAVSSFNTVKYSVEHKNYARAIKIASETIDRIQKSLMITVFDHRAYSYGMQGQFQLAINDAEKIIARAPDLAVGYLRLGSVYVMQGRQRSAIRTFECGLQNVSETSSGYKQLVRCKESALRSSESRVDFVARLPTEIVHDVVMLLPRDNKVSCLNVSRIWRKTLLECKDLWRDLVSADGQTDYQITSVLPNIATHIENLDLCTSNNHIWIRYLRCMRSGAMNNIKAFRLGATTAKLIQPAMIMAVTTAFCNISAMLTKLELDLSESASGVVISLLDLLHIFVNLKTLDYTVDCALPCVVGEPELLDGTHGLVDLTLKSPLINGANLQPVLQQCPQLRRLVLTGCTSTIWNVVSEFCPQLEIIGCNPKFPVVPLDHTQKTAPGLRHIWALAPKGATRLPAGDCLALVQRYMKTIETAHLHLSSADIPNLGSMFGDLKLDKLRRLIYCGEPSSDIEPLLLRSIQGCTALSNFCVAAPSNVELVVSTLLALPPLKSLGIAYTVATDGHTSLKQLFDHYATISRRSASLESIMLRWCSSTTDEVLSALAGIKSLQAIKFMGLSRVTPQGLQGFFRVQSNNITTVTLVGMPSITDIHLIALGNMKQLEVVNLEELEYITDDGIVNMMDRTSTIHSLSVVECSLVTESAIQYARRVLQNVTI